MHARIVGSVEPHGPRTGRDMTAEVPAILSLGGGHRRRDHHSRPDGAHHKKLSSYRSHRPPPMTGRPERTPAAQMWQCTGCSGRAGWPAIGDEGPAYLFTCRIP